MILSDRDIKSYMNDKRIVIDPYPADCDIQPASVDLKLSKDIKSFHMRDVHNEKVICVKDKPYMIDVPIPDEGLILYPNQFVLGSTIERVELSNLIVARVEGKSSLGRIGLAVHITAGFIDPGFRGNITLELKNMGPRPIMLKYGMYIAQICFTVLSKPTFRTYGHEKLNSKYQDSKGTIGSNGVDE